MNTRFLRVQIKKIEMDKWCEGCGRKQDPGPEYVLDWIHKNASWFRHAWEVSECKNCQRWADCGVHLKQECQDFVTGE